MRRGQVWGRWAITIALPIIVGACAATAADAALPLQDPNEHANRQMLAVNQEMLRPVAEAVQTVLPRPVHDRLHDFNSNLKEPRIFVNNFCRAVSMPPARRRRACHEHDLRTRRSCRSRDP